MYQKRMKINKITTSCEIFVSIGIKSRSLGQVCLHVCQEAARHNKVQHKKLNTKLHTKLHQKKRSFH
jgi:hypothetical protein